MDFRQGTLCKRGMAMLWGWGSFLAFLGTVSLQSGKPHQLVTEEMQVRLPRLVQVMMVGGDRYLAANLLGFRVLVADTGQMTAGHFAVQAQLQQDIAWLNPAHEDNYYIAAALLPWNGQLDVAQEVLRRARDARPFDWSPQFYHAFNDYHFYGNSARASQWLHQAADRAEMEQDRMALLNLAAKWAEKGSSLLVAAGVVEGMAAQSRSPAFAKYLSMRAARLRELNRLRNAAERYSQRFGKTIGKLDDLVSSGLVPRLPKDPLGIGYGVNGKGIPVFSSEIQDKNERNPS